MKVISLVAVFLAFLAIVSAQFATNTTDAILPPVPTNTTDSLIPVTSGFYPLDPNVVKGGPCQVQKIGGTTENNCCYDGFVTINKRCEINIGQNPCVEAAPKCTKDEACVGTYKPKNTPCLHKGRLARKKKLGRKNGRRNNKKQQGARTAKGLPRAKDNAFNTNGFCFGLAVAEKAAERDPTNFPSNKVVRQCKTLTQIRKQVGRFNKINSQALKNRKQPRRGKAGYVA